MNKREVAFKARGIVYNLLASYFDVGQPFEDAHNRNWTEEETQCIHDVLRKIQERYAR